MGVFLQFNENEILQDSGNISHAVAVTLAENEYENYQTAQDRIFESDFDRSVKKILESKRDNVHDA